jgi:hypothetical protein
MVALDGVVTVCNTTAHLAGALGLSGLVLTPRAASWRYQLAGATLPWYPSLTVLRQHDAGDWTAVLGEAAATVLAKRSRSAVTVWLRRCAGLSQESPFSST